MEILRLRPKVFLFSFPSFTYSVPLFCSNFLWQELERKCKSFRRKAITRAMTCVRNSRIFTFITLKKFDGRWGMLCPRIHFITIAQVTDFLFRSFCSVQGTEGWVLFSLNAWPQVVIRVIQGTLNRKNFYVKTHCRLHFHSQNSLIM